MGAVSWLCCLLGCCDKSLAKASQPSCLVHSILLGRSGRPRLSMSMPLRSTESQVLRAGNWGHVPPLLAFFLKASARLWSTSFSLTTCKHGISRTQAPQKAPQKAKIAPSCPNFAHFAI
jgi:hypothetical protein